MPLLIFPLATGYILYLQSWHVRESGDIAELLSPPLALSVNTSEAVVSNNYYIGYKTHLIID